MKILKPAFGALLLGFSLTAFTTTVAAQTTEGTSAGAPNTQQTAPQAQTGSQATLTDEQLDRRHEAEKRRCNDLSGDEKDLCEKQADANRDAEQADSEPRAERPADPVDAFRDANKEKKEAQYNAEKRKCEAISGDAQNRCMDELKARYGRTTPG